MILMTLQVSLFVMNLMVEQVIPFVDNVMIIQINLMVMILIIIQTIQFVEIIMMEVQFNHFVVILA